MYNSTKLTDWVVCFDTSAGPSVLFYSTEQEAKTAKELMLNSKYAKSAAIYKKIQ